MAPNLPDWSVADWIAKLRARDEDAATFLYQFCYYRCRHMLYTWSEGQPEDIEDLAHDSIVKVILQIDKPGFEHILRSSFIGLVAKIAINVCQDWRRKVKKDRIFNFIPFEELQPSDEYKIAQVEADDSKAKQNILETLEKCRQALPPRDQELLELWMAGMSYAMIGERLNITANNVGVRRNNICTVKLRRCLAQQGISFE